MRWVGALSAYHLEARSVASVDCKRITTASTALSGLTIVEADRARSAWWMPGADCRPEIDVAASRSEQRKV